MDVHDPGTTSGIAPETAYAYLEGRFIPLRDARISIMTHAFLYGSAIFEGIRGYYNQKKDDIYVLKMIDHYARLKTNGRLLMINLERTPEQLADLTIEVIRRSGYKEDIYIRPMLYKSSQRIGLKWGQEHEFLVFAVPIGSYLTKERPLNLMVSSWRRIQDNAIPARAKVSGSYVNVSLAAQEAREGGFDEGILLNEDGTVSEAAGMNIFIVRNGKLITTPVYDNVLEGITRSIVLQLAREQDIPIEERSINRSELYASDEVFLCGTGAEISGVGSIDRRRIGKGEIGPITNRIQEIYFQAVRGNLSSYQSWLTPVYNRKFSDE
jgi:branched-chain amino acid aminotransferase